MTPAVSRRFFVPIGLCVCALLALAALSASAQGSAGKTLNIYVVDVEGGNATLFVSPSGESLLIDTGNAGAAAPRDAGRIMAAAHDAGITRIDHLITTHWHGDHVGGLAELATRIPIRHFIDHGANVQPAPGIDEFLKDGYPRLYEKGTHTIVKPGDRIAVAGLDVLVVSSAGQVLTTALPGAGKANPYCAAFKPTINSAEDAQSVGTYIRFGRFRALHPGDLPTTKEFELMCPNSRIDAVDVLLGLHHGQDTSNSEVLVHAIRPRVAIVNNGTRKGGWPVVMKTIFSSPGLEDVWQIHFSLLGGQEYTVPGMFIANAVDDQPAAMPIAPAPLPAGADAPPPPAHEGPAYWIKVAARADGVFTVTNARNGFSKTYEPGPRDRR
jgi:beta-lactamase superfamily II metal-dependent hydrolase